jgi:hypothetical protein
MCPIEDAGCVRLLSGPDTDGLCRNFFGTLNDRLSRSFKPQIAPAVIVVITVDMLNLTFWKFAGHVQPDEVVREILSAIDGDDSVSI